MSETKSSEVTVNFRYVKEAKRYYLQIDGEDVRSFSRVEVEQIANVPVGQIEEVAKIVRDNIESDVTKLHLLQKINNWTTVRAAAKRAIDSATTDDTSD